MIRDTKTRLFAIVLTGSIGFQVAAATIGIGFLPGLLGWFGVNYGLESITVALLVLMVSMTIFYEIWRRMPVSFATKVLSAE